VGILAECATTGILTYASSALTEVSGAMTALTCWCLGERPEELSLMALPGRMMWVTCNTSLSMHVSFDEAKF
jgi:hypothetical protein